MESNIFNNQPTIQPASTIPPASDRNSKTALYVVIAVLATVIVGLVVALVVILVANNGDEGKAGGAKAAKDSSSEERDIQREDDISRFLTAANDYQTNNNGKTPWASDKTNEKWVQRYIDNGCEFSYAIGDVEFYKCRVGSTEFRDPDGEVYKIRYVGDLSGSYNLDGAMSEWPNNHELVVATNAMCGDDGMFEKGYGPRQYAMAYRLEDGSITCNDNH